MATILDVAKYICEKKPELTAMKLQKLAYYAQAWHLVWEEKPLFEEDFQAWANGPVCPDLFRRHSGHFKVTAGLFDTANADCLTKVEKENIDKVLDFYGDKTSQWLSHLTHREAPWKDARGGLPEMASCREIISKSSMHEYYSALD